MAAKEIKGLGLFITCMILLYMFWRYSLLGASAAKSESKRQKSLTEKSRSAHNSTSIQDESADDADTAD